MNSTKLRTIAIASATAGALMLSSAGGAAADVPKVKIGGQVSLEFTPPGHFEGRVNSRKRFCERNRRVNLRYWMMPSGPPDVIGSDRTNATGLYEIDIEPFAIAGEYQAAARRKVVHKPDKTFICKPLVSLRYQF